MDSTSLFLIVGGVAALGVALYLYMEYQARVLRTRVVNVPGGMRFEAHDFSIEVQRADKQLLIRSKTGTLTRTPLSGGETLVQHGPLEAVLPAPGLRIDIVRVSLKAQGELPAQSTGYCTITVSASDALNNAAKNVTGGHSSVLTIERVLEPVALSLSNFAAQIRVWVEKMDYRLKLESVERLRQEKEAAQAAADEQLLAEARANQGTDAALTETDREALAGVQIANWRKTAGFTGTASEVSIDPEGRVAWFLDLCNDGRITLHADKRTIHTSLDGAEIASLGGELEIGVRDDYWTEEEPALRNFKVFKGLPPDERRAWKERLEMVRDSLRKGAGRR